MNNLDDAEKFFKELGFRLVVCSNDKKLRMMFAGEGENLCVKLFEEHNKKWYQFKYIINVGKFELYQTSVKKLKLDNETFKRDYERIQKIAKLMEDEL